MLCLISIEILIYVSSVCSFPLNNYRSMNYQSCLNCYQKKVKCLRTAIIQRLQPLGCVFSINILPLVALYQWISLSENLCLHMNGWFRFSPEIIKNCLYKLTVNKSKSELCLLYKVRQKYEYNIFNEEWIKFYTVN